MQSYILSAKRTAIGSLMGTLSSRTAPQLGGVAIAAALQAAGISGDEVDEVIMGNVLTGGVGQAPARQAAHNAGLPRKVECLTINKVCGSGLKAVMLADQAIRLGDANVIIAGGQESMSQAPYFLPKARTGYKMGNGEIVDMMIHDGLWDVYNDIHMGAIGEKCASECYISREEQDNYATMSYERAISAQKNGLFAEEIAPVEVTAGRETLTISRDEEPEKVRFEKIKTLRPAFDKEGTVTAANASSINDGAAALVLVSEEKLKTLTQKPLAKIVAHCSVAQEPDWFTTAPAKAIQKVLAKANMKIDDIDLFEINEAFSLVSIYAARELNIPMEKVNINGGAVSLGHPIGASGARILTTLLHALKHNKKKYGLATLCIGGGEANAMIVEMVD